MALNQSVHYFLFSGYMNRNAIRLLGHEFLSFDSAQRYVINNGVPNQLFLIIPFNLN